MNENVRNPRIIIDASYIIGMDECKAQSCFGAMCARGGHIVIIDTLSYELCSSTKGSKKWSEAKVKLAGYRNYIEVWKHVSEMCTFELNKKYPYGDPLDDKRTERMREMLANNPQWEPPNLKDIINQAKQERESDGIIGLFKGLVGAQEFERFAKEIKRKSGDKNKLMKYCYDVVNSPFNIRRAIDIILSEADIGSSLDPQNVNNTWVIWHFGKSLLALFCDTQRKDEDSFNISKDTEKRLINTGHDLDYLVSLAFADVIASHDKREMSDYRQWMFGDAKPLIDSYEPEEIASVMDSLKT